MKKSFFIIIILGTTIPVLGQKLPTRIGEYAEQSSRAASQVGRQSMRHVPGMVGGVSTANLASQLERKIATSVPVYSAAQIAALTKRGQVSTQLLQASLVLPGLKRLQVLRNEFLTISAENKVPVTPAQFQQALQLLRTDLDLHLKGLDSLKSYQTGTEMIQAFSKNPAVRQALEAVGDASGLGLYGSLEDEKLLHQFYNALQQTPLEPLALTVAVRACVNIKAMNTLEKILQQAPRTETYEALSAWLEEDKILVNKVEKTGEIQPVNLLDITFPLLHISRLSRLHLDSSARASRSYCSLRVLPQENSAAVAEAVQPHPIVDLAVMDAELQQQGTLRLEVPELVKKVERTEDASSLPGKKRADLLPVSSQSGVYEPVIPEQLPSVNLITKQYPSGLQDAAGLVRYWQTSYELGRFHPRDQIEGIVGMSPEKANNVMEYLYYMTMEEAERTILQPMLLSGRLPDFMYDARLIPGTKRLPAGYYKNKFNDNVKRFLELAAEDGSVVAHNVELTDLIMSMADYTFEQGFAFTNDARMSAELRANWKVIVNEVQRRGLQADRHLMNRMWTKPIELKDGKIISLRMYFSQTSPSAFFEEGRMPQFYLNSPKWVSWENERRNLAAQAYIDQMESTPSNRPWWQRGWEKVQDFFVLGKRSNYLTLDQFGQLMTDQYLNTYGRAWQENRFELGEDPTGGPSTCTMQVNNFDKLGGVCQSSFGDGGYMGRLPQGYDGTSTVSRFTPIEFKDVPVVGFDLGTLAPQVMTLESVPYLKDLKVPNINKTRASIMVRDGLDVTRDLLSVQQAEAALFKIPHLKATIYPKSRLAAYEGTIPPFMDGGGLAGYLALFTPDFYPLKKIMRLRWQNGRPHWVPEYFVRKEIPALSGPIHRDHLTFSYMLFGRIKKMDTPEQPAAPTEPEE